MRIERPGACSAPPQARIVTQPPAAGIGDAASDIAIQFRLTNRDIAAPTAEQTGRAVEQTEKDARRDCRLAAGEVTT